MNFTLLDLPPPYCTQANSRCLATGYPTSSDLWFITLRIVVGTFSKLSKRHGEQNGMGIFKLINQLPSRF